jgi:hypothetical protein
MADFNSSLAEAALGKEYLLSEDYFLALNQQCEESVVVRKFFEPIGSGTNPHRARSSWKPFKRWLLVKRARHRRLSY